MPVPGLGARDNKNTRIVPRHIRHTCGPHRHDTMTSPRGHRLKKPPRPPTALLLFPAQPPQRWAEAVLQQHVPPPTHRDRVARRSHSSSGRAGRRVATRRPQHSAACASARALRKKHVQHGQGVARPLASPRGVGQGLREARKSGRSKSLAGQRISNSDKCWSRRHSMVQGHSL